MAAQLLNITLNGSHINFHFEGQAGLTIVRPHGGDGTVPASYVNNFPKASFVDHRSVGEPIA
jgi:ribosomal protein L35AE/L33A